MKLKCALVQSGQICNFGLAVLLLYRRTTGSIFGLRILSGCDPSRHLSLFVVVHSECNRCIDLVAVDPRTMTFCESCSRAAGACFISR
ncbi:hypothetical protein C8R44DRAFT_782107 [Mycena epipterygia]|nr:hypothetical protein C8R44DRAFT_782107 [Mycena epipterygia]